MLNYKAPMNLDESAYAEKYHHLIYAFLGKHKLPMDEFYDIAVFGYLRAVRKYLARPELREQYKFSTIAYRAMSCDVHHSRSIGCEPSATVRSARWMRSATPTTSGIRSPGRWAM